jgi:hypothetical protein
VLFYKQGVYDPFTAGLDPCGAITLLLVHEERSRALRQVVDLSILITHSCKCANETSCAMLQLVNSIGLSCLLTTRKTLTLVPTLSKLCDATDLVRTLIRHKSYLCQVVDRRILITHSCKCANEASCAKRQLVSSIGLSCLSTTGKLKHTDQL